MTRSRIAGLVVCLVTFVAVTAYAQGGQTFQSLQRQLDALTGRVTALENQPPCSCTSAPTWDSGWMTAPPTPEGQFTMAHPLGAQIVNANIVSQFRQPGAADFSTGSGVRANDVEITVGSGLFSTVEVRVLVWAF